MNRFGNRKTLSRALTLFGSTLFCANVSHAAVEISAKPTANMNCSGGVCTPTAKKAVLNVADLANMLASGDATVKSDSVAQDIEIDAKLSWTSSNRLTLDAWRSITVNKPVDVAGQGGLTITTNDGGANGDFRVIGGRIKFWDIKSSLIINGDSYVLENGFRALIHDLKQNGDGNYALAKAMDAGKKNVFPTSPIAFVGGNLEGLGNTISNLTINSGPNEPSGFEGLVGLLLGNIRNLGLNRVAITGTDANVGALVGYMNSGEISNCFAKGSISVTGSSVGGLVGADFSSHPIKNSFANVAVTTTTEADVGGLVGKIQGVEEADGIIDQSYATGAVSGGDEAYVGGLVGNSFGGLILNSYATGSVTGGANALVGGLVGNNTDNFSQSYPIVSASYSTGFVSGGENATVGGLLGSDVADAQTTHAYWDTDTSGISDPSKGAGNIADDPGITGLTDAQLKSGLPAGFYKKVWKQNASINNGYPYLIDNPPPN